MMGITSPEPIDNGHLIKVTFEDGEPIKVTRMGRTYTVTECGSDDDGYTIYRLDTYNTLIFNLKITKNNVLEEYIYNGMRWYTFYERIRQ